MDSFEIRNLGEAIDAKGTLAAALAIAAGTQAYAVPVRYDNPAGPDHYQWDTFAGNNLDIRMSAAAQNNGYIPGVTVNADYRYGSGYYGLLASRAIGYYAGSAQSSLFGADGLLRSGYYLQAITPGSMVGIGGQSFDYMGFAYADMSFYYYDTDYGAYSGLRSFFSEGLNYLGLRIVTDTVRGLETHYGWMAVEVGLYDLPEAYGFGDLEMLAITNAVAWGWETEPYTPIAAGIPAPGSLAALAFGAVAVGGRGRRKKSA